MNDDLSDLFEPLRRAQPPPELFDRIARRAWRRMRSRRWIPRAAAALVGFLTVYSIAHSLARPRETEAGSAAELFARLSAPGEARSLPERELLRLLMETER